MMSNDTEEKKEEVTVEIIDGLYDAISNPEIIQFNQPIECSGLKKEELMQYLKDPYWVWLRIILLGIFILSWLGMLVLAIVVIILTPKCPARPQQEWWQEGVLYCVHTKSFLDTDNDGVGDLNGIKAKLDYIKDEVKADTVSVGSLQIEGNSSDVRSATNTNFTSISPEFGSMQDFEDLIKQVHRRGMNFIMDLNPFSTTTSHPWFQQSRYQIAPYAEYYVWSNQSAPPEFVLDSQRNQHYATDAHQHPILNLNNPNVIHQVVEAIRFWLDLKVDGIKIDGSRDVLKLWSDGKVKINNGTYEELVAGLVDAWTDAVQQHIDAHRHSLTFKGHVLMADIEAPTNRTEGRPFKPINNNLLRIKSNCHTACVRSLVADWLEVFGSRSSLSNWRVSSADAGRLASRLNDIKVNAIYLLLLTLPGVPHVYYGDEIALKNGLIASNSEEFSTNIMLWTNEMYNGFSRSPPWQPDVLTSLVKDVQSQMALGSGMSHLRVFNKIASLRSDPSIAWGDMHLSQVNDILVYVRKAQGHPCIIVALNLGEKYATVLLKKGEIADKIVASRVKVLSSTYNFKNDQSELFSDGAEINLSEAILLEPGQGLVLKCIADKKWYS